MDDTGWTSILAISGGGANGAFGAGFLEGWTETGQRPVFRLVTGVSTGALIAPFAFLGGEHDATLRRFYTTLRTEDVVRRKPLLLALAGTDAFADSTPLARIIEETVTEELLAAIAREYRRGRRLYVLTTNLDARRAVAWNMGAIAVSGRPEALELFRQVMRASASIPVAMGPVYIPVEAHGLIYDEMHVDGGVTAEVFFYGFMLDLPSAARWAGVDPQTAPPMRIFILRNSQFRTPYEQVDPRVLPIASRAIEGLISTQALGDLYRIYGIASRDGIAFNLARIPDDYIPQAAETFDPVEMRRLYELGRTMAAAGYAWETQPPGLLQGEGVGGDD